jgi:hypothetical protein
MPLATPFLPLTVSASSAFTPLAVFVHPPPPPSQSSTTSRSNSASTARPQHDDAHDDSHLTTPDDTAKSHPVPASIPPVAARPHPHTRRLTLSRLPLLRKGSRELARSPSTTHHHHHHHAKASSTSTAGTAPPPSLLLSSTASPRSSTSTVRGHHFYPARAPSFDGHEQPISHEADSSQKPGKMHQTSSRLLRMTDDERPYTRVRFDFDFDFPIRVAICVTIPRGSRSEDLPHRH